MAEALGAGVRRNIRLLSAFSFCNDFRVYAPIVVVYFAQVTGSLALATLLFSIAKIASSAFEVPAGVFSDFIGRKLTIVLGQAASVASLALSCLPRRCSLSAPSRIGSARVLPCSEPRFSLSP